MTFTAHGPNAFTSVEQLRAIVKKKDSASYRGEYYMVDEATHGSWSE